jgi:hypothetical protein
MRVTAGFFGFMIKKGQIGDQIQDHNIGTTSVSSKSFSGRDLRQTPGECAFFRTLAFGLVQPNRRTPPETDAVGYWFRAISSLLSAARPIVGTQAELIFVSAHCPGRLRVPGRSEALARISHFYLVMLLQSFCLFSFAGPSIPKPEGGLFLRSPMYL